MVDGEFVEHVGPDQPGLHTQPAPLMPVEHEAVPGDEQLEQLLAQVGPLQDKQKRETATVAPNANDW